MGSAAVATYGSRTNCVVQLHRISLFVTFHPPLFSAVGHLIFYSAVVLEKSPFM